MKRKIPVTGAVNVTAAPINGTLYFAIHIFSPCTQLLQIAASVASLVRKGKEDLFVFFYIYVFIFCIAVKEAVIQ